MRKELDWPISTLEQQRNWIGRSEGADVVFSVKGKTEKIRVFTNSSRHAFGATYMVLAPEHPLVDIIASPAQKEQIQQYRKETAFKSELERGTEKEKTGVFTGGYAINPATGKEIPIWIADYVLMDNGTGANHGGAVMMIVIWSLRRNSVWKLLKLSMEDRILLMFC